ncbi:ABC transporter ATP-binding protein [Clostridium botulinum]|uniref:ABC transporter, ATP-binding protein n=1 Tax=Clostridium botulinum (strain Eklund 17B / Type B) TaxID=935198 RepID=B2TI75_CLOBB|nr:MULTISPECIES: ABC transporter ATP-binding protein [Clostridium]ACD24379.1 ABC transporter, ATP-binding protein [Clostridium botulinum B str. Eklund 17B (NRP)]MBN1045387.1 ABC transporter ATP-binding protein [Clostridium botulinum]MBN1067928.1 ABC transporter ATP-binding protein [Clostridium botulinum]MBY6977263.1 ABC transporter ATP-binding protein [Clostridium botulinum]MBY6999420.1 ABC transporter ATP-binding protein [Clostridium botulinum]
MNKLEIKDLTKIYGRKRANDGITVTLENGVYGLLGPNGAGKTTLMKQITTLIKPDKGEILYNGEDIFNMDDKYRDLIGYLPQEFGVYKNFTAKHFLQYVGALKGMNGKILNSKVDELLELVGLYDVRNKAIGKFSGGMKRRVGIAQVLLNDPKIIVLDEPTAGLDPQERTRFRNLIAKISRDKVIILSTHIISDIESVAKETIMIKKGKLLMKGTHREILSDMNNKVYNISVNDESEINRIQDKYKVVSIQSDINSTILRVVSDTIPKEINVEPTSARFEDVYMFYFDLENSKEV